MSTPKPKPVDRALLRRAPMIVPKMRPAQFPLLMDALEERSVSIGMLNDDESLPWDQLHAAAAGFAPDRPASPAGHGETRHRPVRPLTVLTCSEHGLSPVRCDTIGKTKQGGQHG